MNYNRRAEAVSIVLWWGSLTLLFWAGGHVRDSPAALVRCAASAALLISLGETAHWLRHRIHRATRRSGTP
ncbi:hypothetical protein L1606_34090 [Streptomyces spororaveus]|uniref:hypothetical protein n=1 Tax=Streptomyces spororaveus TaxID=284039 RepID=UPI002079F6E3|nr:hypothetical protein [Streptomyces spororaveus]MCM9083056.1 hypothetical protein [Streptomyces spororaveus]